MPSLKQLWRIYHVENCRHTTPGPKNKFVVIVHIDGDAYGCLINSVISDWIKQRPHLLACEADFPGLQNRGINYDSFVDCRNLYPFLDTELTSDRGEISNGAKTAILDAILKCPTIERKHKNAILTRENWPQPPIVIT